MPFIFIYIHVYNIFMVNSETFFNCALFINQKIICYGFKVQLRVISSAPCAVVQLNALNGKKGGFVVLVGDASLSPAAFCTKVY